MSLESQDHVSTVDPYDFIKISLNPDGTITRLPFLPITAASLDPTPPNAVLTKDVPLNPDHATWVRLFLPNKPQPSDALTNQKLPLIVYFHAGGFVVMSASSAPNHHFCSLMATHLQAVVVSVDYRLAPEHRLPAAYDDAADALRWLNSINDDWIREFADLSNCYVMGTSAGGNIAYRVGLYAHERLRIKGLILHHPFFGGSKRTSSELKMLDDKNLPMAAVDLMWELALPIGVDFDHEYCNPLVVDRSKEMEGIRWKGCRVMVVGGEGDPMIDRQKELAQKLQENGIQVEAWFSEGNTHGVELVDHVKAEKLIQKIKSFIFISSATCNYRLDVGGFPGDLGLSDKI